MDVGATFIKHCSVDSDGHLLDEVTRQRTPFPCWPETLVEVLAGVITNSGRDRAGVGFPGDMSNGRVIEPGNLSRAGGVMSPIDPLIEKSWLEYHLQEELQLRCHAQVRVVNDATLAAHGYARGHGRELIFTLGTGLGISLVVDGQWQKIRDVGSAPYRDVGTYDEVFGEPAREADQERWRERLAEALADFVSEFQADLVHVGGGNARHLQHSDFTNIGCVVVFNDNEGTLRGAARLFAD